MKTLVIVMTFLVFSLLWIPITDAILGWLVKDPEDMVRLGTYKGILYIALAGVLIYALVSKALRTVPDSGAQSDDPGPRLREPWTVPVLFVLVLLAVGLTGFGAFRYQEKVLYEKVRKELSHLALSERNYLDLWLQERLKDLAMTAEDPFLVKAFQDSRHGDTRGREALLSRLEGFKRIYGYQAVQLLDASGGVVAKTSGAPALTPVERQSVVSLKPEDAPRLVWGLGTEHGAPRLHLGTLAPLVDVQTRRLAGSVYFHLDNQSLLDVVQSDQPTFYASGEMVLVCPWNGQMIFLSQTRLGPSPMVSVGLDQTELVGVQALRSEEGLFEGQDYRGVPVLAASAKLESLPWTIFTKLDHQEISAPLVRLAWVYLGLAFLVLAGSGFLLAAWWDRHQALVRLEQNRVRREKELLDQRLKSLSSHANDIVLLVDDRGRILDANDRALEAYGYTLEQLLSLHIKDIRTLDCQVDFERQFEMVKREQSLRFETEHVRKNGQSFPVEVSSRAFRQGEATWIQSIVRDITERKQAEQERETTVKLLRLLNEPNHTHELAAHLTRLLQEWSDCEAVGIRLREGEDFPYFETRGLSAGFVRSENQLCARDPKGQLLRDDHGEPILECMCGNILCGRFDPEKPFFTAHGSFWTNGSSALLASTTEADRQARTRNRCNGEGYESVALIPLRSGEEILGLVQLNDRSPGRFTPKIIDFLERAGDQIGLALAQRRAQQSLCESEERMARILEATRVGTWEWHIQTGEVRFNERWAGIAGYTLEELEPLSIQTWTGLAHPEDLERSHKLLEQHLAGELPYYDLECRMRHKDGSWVWVHDRGQVTERDAEGRPLVMHGTHSDISDRKRAELERLESEYRYASLFTSIQEGLALHEIIQDASGRPVDYRFLDINPAFEAMTGLPREGCIGHTVKEILPGTEAYWIETYGQVALSGEPLQFENYSSDLDRWYQVYAFSPEAGRFAVLSMDITERKKAEEELRRSEERFRSLVESAPEPIFVQTKGCFAYVNAAALELFRAKSPEDLIGTPILDRIHPDHREEVRTRIRELNLKLKKVPEREITLVALDGSPVDASTSAVPVRYGEEDGALVFARDITERRKAERAIQRMNEELELRVQERTAQLEAANRELEAFSYSVSHDLKAPLRGIDGFSLALVEDYGEQLDAPARHYLERVRSGAQRMGQIIEDLLKLSRVNRGEMEYLEVDLSAMAGRILDEFRHRDPERRVEGVVQPGLRVDADPRLMSLALENLLGNAWKFTSKTPAARIEWGAESREGQSVYFIRDNGAGFDMTYVGKLFNAFQRLHSTQEFEGTGIGLAIVQRIIHRHGGRIWAQSEPGKGATFYFVLRQ